MTNPAYFALYARRRMDLYGATPEDFAAVKVKNARHGLRQPERALPQGGQRRGRAGQRGRLRPAAPARHLRDLRRRGRGRADQPGLRAPARARRPGAGRARSRRSRRPSRTPSSTCRNFATDSAAGGRPRAGPHLQGVDRARGVRGGRHRPRGRRPAPRSTTSPPRSSSTGSRTSGCASAARPRRCCAPARPRSAAGSRSTRRGGLACFGEAVPAQALAQVCEVTWQLRGQAEGRQVEGARVGITANQGLFGHGSAVLLEYLTPPGQLGGRKVPQPGSTYPPCRSPAAVPQTPVPFLGFRRPTCARTQEQPWTSSTSPGGSSASSPSTTSSSCPITIGLSAIVAGYETAWVRTRNEQLAAADEVLRQAVPDQLRHRRGDRHRAGVPVRHELERLLALRRRHLRRAAGRSRACSRSSSSRRSSGCGSSAGTGCPPRLHAACIWLVHLGTLFSAYFILAANSWMQHPVGYTLQPRRPAAPS